MSPPLNSQHCPVPALQVGMGEEYAEKDGVQYRIRCGGRGKALGLGTALDGSCSVSMLCKPTAMHPSCAYLLDTIDLSQVDAR